MGSGVDVKMGVSGLAQFKQSMQQAQQSVKTLDAALKLNEKQLKNNGDKETYMQQKAKLLQQQIAAQNQVIKAAQQALTSMTKSGVDPASKAYQQMQQKLLDAQSALLDMQNDLSSVGQTAAETAQQTDKLTDSLNGVNKKVSFDSVISGIGTITSAMASAASKVESLATNIWDALTAAASWADNENTLAAMYGIDTRTLQQMQYAADFSETSVDAIIRSRQKLKNAMVSDSQDIADMFIKLGVDTGYATGSSKEIRAFRDWEDVFWDVGDALLHYEDAIERDVLAQQLFGRSWMELMPLFLTGREKYNELLEEAPTVDEGAIGRLNDLQDALDALEGQFNDTWRTLISELAPAFTDVGNTLTDLLKRFNEYLETEEGQEKLESLREAILSLFEGLEDVDFGEALDTATTIFDAVVFSLGWIKDNCGSVVDAFSNIAGAVGWVITKVDNAITAVNELLGIHVYTEEEIQQEAEAAELAWREEHDATNHGDYGVYNWVAGLQTSGVPGVDALSSDALYALGVMAALGGMSSDWAYDFDSLDDLLQAMPGGLYQALEEFKKNFDPHKTWNSKLLNDYWTESLAPLVEEYAAAFGLSEQETATFNRKFRTTWAESLFSEMTIEDLLGQLFAELSDEAGGEDPKLQVDPVLPENTADLLQEQMDGVAVTVDVVPKVEEDDSRSGYGGRLANGMPFVPFDGYIAQLHKGERVVPASQNKSFTSNSNLYVESMYMNNGLDAQALAAAMAAESRRIRSGFGS